LQKASGVAARPRGALNEPGSDRVGHNDEYNWQRAARLQQRPDGDAAGRQYDIGCERNQVCHIAAATIGILHIPPKSTFRLPFSRQPIAAGSPQTQLRER
jgi:hypothetical protein